MTNSKVSINSVYGYFGVALMLGFSFALSGCGGDKKETNLPVLTGGAGVSSLDGATSEVTAGAQAGSGGQGGSAGQQQNTSCCSAHASRGCNEQAVQDCICVKNQLKECCENMWDTVCVEMVKLLECKVCPGDCCTATNKPGCEDNKKAQTCVCNNDPPCCAMWDEFCVQVNTAICGGECPAK